MTGPFSGQPDWWSLLARAPFMGASGVGVPGMGAAGFDPRAAMGAASAGGPALQQFLAACEQHMALMQKLSVEMGAGLPGGQQSLFERLRAWQGTVGGAGADPFTILRELGTFGVPSGHAQLESLCRMSALQSRALELQGRMLAHGAELVHDAMQRFSARAEQEPSGLSSLYATWIDCAEEAYASRAHSEDYCQVQAELTNTLNALRAEQRAQIEEWARTLDLPTRTEMNALIQRIRELENPPPAATPQPSKKPPPKKASRRPAPRGRAKHQP